MRDKMLEDPHSFNRLMTAMPIMCNGKNTVLEIAEKLQVPFWAVKHYANMWAEKGSTDTNTVRKIRFRDWVS